MKRDGATMVYVGPSLPVAEVRALLPSAELAPPIAALDVARLLKRRRPARLAIIDGYFERMAAVWHKELLLALELGVEVWGAASMGALRAAELDRFGMRGVGAIYRDYRRGRLVRDGDVAVAHLPIEGGYAALSVPLVDVRAQLRRAVDAGVIDGATARAALRRATTIAYWERSWDDVDAAIPGRRRPMWIGWRTTHPFSQKADDARALLRTLAATAAAAPAAPPVPRTWAFVELLRQVGWR